MSCKLFFHSSKDRSSCYSAPKQLAQAPPPIARSTTGPITGQAAQPPYQHRHRPDGLPQEPHGPIRSSTSGPSIPSHQALDGPTRNLTEMNPPAARTETDPRSSGSNSTAVEGAETRPKQLGSHHPASAAFVSSITRCSLTHLELIHRNAPTLEIISTSTRPPTQANPLVLRPS